MPLTVLQENNLMTLARPRKNKTAELTGEVVVTNQQLHAGKDLAKSLKWQPTSRQFLVNVINLAVPGAK